MKQRNVLFKYGHFSRLLFLICTLCYSSFLFSQEVINVSGKVVDENGESVIGATVRVPSTNDGTLTDIDGKFHLSVAKGCKIEISFVGYVSQTIKIINDSFQNIVLIEDAIAIDDVVVVGYGTQKKETLTGSVTNLKNDEIIRTKAPSLAQVLEGKIPGLRIRQGDGEPGNFSSDINIRGFGAPLYVIDGVIRDGSSEFQRLNPEDIESISVLKDATAAIYGMNSANGVIIVTTKKGKGSPRITLNGNMGLVSTTSVPKMTNASQYMTMMNEAQINAGRPPLLAQEELLKWQQGAPGYESVDLYAAAFDKFTTQYQSTLSLEGGTDKMNYYGSIGYSKDNSLLKSNSINYDKYTFRSNVSLKINQNLTASVNLGGRYDTKMSPYSSFYRIFQSARANPPTVPIYANNNPKYYNQFPQMPSPVVLSDNDYTGEISVKHRNIQTLFTLDYNVPFVDGLKLRGSLAYDYDAEFQKTIRKSFNTYVYDEATDKYTPIINESPSLVRDYKRDYDKLDMQFQADYNKKINVHTLGATYVFERRQGWASHVQGERKFDFFTFGELDAGRDLGQLANGNSGEEAFLSHVGRLKYDYAGKYFAEFACRYDGSYRYAPGKRWAFFPSASFAWRMSEENFIKDNFSFIDNLKLRFSLGRSGQDAGDPFQFIEGYYINSGGAVLSPNNFTNGVSFPSLSNKNLTWIKIDMYNIGVDFSVLKGLLSFEFDVYQRDRKGLLANRYGSLPNTFGSSLPQENLNGDRTRGFDLQITHNNRIGDFQYSVSANLNYGRTQNRYIESGPFRSSMERWRGQSAYRWTDFVWGYQIDGRFDNMDQLNSAPIQNGDMGNSKELPGDFILKDVNGDGLISGDDQIPLFWSGSPLVHYGLNIQASWKNFDFYVLFQGSGMYTVQFNEVYAEMLAFKGGNTPEYFFDRWHREDPYDPNSKWIAGEWPAVRLVQDMGALYTRNTEVWRKNASYLRLKTIELGYTFQNKFLKNIGLGDCRVYVNGNNLLTICDSFVKQFDPEKVEGAYSAGLNYPLTSVFNFGFTLNF